MKIEVILFVFMTILTAMAFKIPSFNITKPVVKNNPIKPFFIKTPEDRKKLKLFPKNSSHYMVNPDHNSTKLADININNKNLHEITKSKSLVTSTETALKVKPKTTRAPLIKLRRFSTGPFTVIQTKPIKKSRNYAQTMFNESQNVNTVIELKKVGRDDTTSREDKNENLNVETFVKDLAVNDNLKSGNKQVRSIENIKQEMFKEIPIESDIEIMHRELNINEHIFKAKMHDRDGSVRSIKEKGEFPIVNDEGQDADKRTKEDLDSSGDGRVESYDETKTFNGLGATEKTFLKHKRDVIEEENLASTVSGFKFTGREPRLTNRATFRNINE